MYQKYNTPPSPRCKRCPGIHYNHFLVFLQFLSSTYTYLKILRSLSFFKLYKWNIYSFDSSFTQHCEAHLYWQASCFHTLSLSWNNPLYEYSIIYVFCWWTLLIVHYGVLLHISSQKSFIGTYSWRVEMHNYKVFMSATLLDNSKVVG